MKKLSLLIIITATAVFYITTGCKVTEPTVPSDPYNGCSEPYDGPTGYRTPENFQTDMRVSRDGRFLSYTSTTSSAPLIFNLKSGEIQKLDLQASLPSNTRMLQSSIVDWCPYADSLVLVSALTETDTNNSGKYVSGYNVYIASLNGKIINRATPLKYGERGSEYGPYIRWLGMSRPEIDYIYVESPWWGDPISYRYKVQGASTTMMQFMDRYSESITGKNYFFETKGLQYIADWFINGSQIVNPSFDAYYSSWSPNERRLALSGQKKKRTNDTTADEKSYRGKEILIYELPVNYIDGPIPYNLQPIHVINLRRDFCKFSFIGTYATFITDSTLAVTMHNDGDSYAPLWEISLDGKIIRQLLQKP